MTKLYVLTGFLGSGKTTILLKLINTLEGKRIGVLQNEFGKLGIDGEILRNKDIDMVEISKGSIFCSCLKLSFVKALTEMAQKSFDYLFVESSGLGDPSNVEEILSVVRQTAEAEFDFCGAICFVDALNFMDEINDLETVNRQLKHCHMAVVTKTDLVEAKQLKELEEIIRGINPICPIKYSSKGSLDLSFLNEDLMQYHWAESEDTTNSAETKPKTLVMNFKEKVPKDKLTAFLKIMQKEAYRIKGFVQLEEGWNQVDLVGSQIAYQTCNEKQASQLVVISRVGIAIIKTIFEQWKTIVGTEMELKN